MRWLVSFWRFIRPLLRWKYSGALIPALYGIGITIAVAGPIPLRFILAFTLVFLGGAYSVTFWMTSDWLRKRRMRLHQREIKRNVKRLAEETAILNRTRNGVTALIGVGTVGLLIWVYMIRATVIANELKQARDDVYDHLSVDPQWITVSASPTIELNILNGGHAKIEEHTITCDITSLWNVNNIAFFNGPISPPRVTSRGLLGGGRGETVECDTLVGFQNPTVNCAEISVGVEFRIENQSDFSMNKQYRFRYDRQVEQRPWMQISDKDNSYSYCDRQYGTPFRPR